MSILDSKSLTTVLIVILAFLCLTWLGFLTEKFSILSELYEVVVALSVFGFAIYIVVKLIIAEKDFDRSRSGK